jgi:hypothetical protein
MKETTMLPDPENDPVILALERDEAYATARHHQEMREEAEAHEAGQRRKLRKLLPKVYAYAAISRLVARWQAGEGTADDVIEKIVSRIRETKAELEQVLASDSADADDF